ncbi:hypothetical protein GTH52_06860 [Clostridium tyrobutyricum]|jgi:hypothetical protein|uniref:Uncharacterized protein n=1 Tax=Clostridium tyrobutyricum DIVETGP TaxID=1408889 RepID=W6N5R1_CLOTY|nr:hypothetical protein [Clostridium tyrobutyricum]AND84399.1 hypothetical protein CTK_C11380 [Clostridium tyrobutyricum]ANP69021.1 hypothetical protein BA182_04830 [Clostridium tyrobutyricum]MBV4417566.1 hypothetical protein [Clostridium tyrobutyricum]MBV4422435.1 hypothetical protein [Clostridium tyrobutyricum]MBV4425849.1 hypothetical protein [Clostridium tyrobutyricum]
MKLGISQQAATGRKEKLLKIYLIGKNGYRLVKYRLSFMVLLLFERKLNYSCNCKQLFRS